MTRKELTIIAGLDDTKTARVHSTEEYIMRSDYVFVVSRIARTQADKYMKDTLNTLVSREQMSEEPEKKKAELVIVCTMTEV